MTTRTELYFFNRVPSEHQLDRFELFGRMAHQNEHPVLVVASEDQLSHWKSVFPQGLFSYSRPDSVNLRRNPFPPETTVLLDPNLSRRDLGFLRSKALHDRLPMTQVA